MNSNERRAFAEALEQWRCILFARLSKRQKDHVLLTEDPGFDQNETKFQDRSDIL